MPELTITSTYVHSRVDSNTFTMGNPVTESTLTLCQRRLYPLVRDFGFGLGVAVSFLLALGQNRFERKWETSFPDTEHQFSQLGRWKNQFLAMRSCLVGKNQLNFGVFSVRK
jgi:hypothetical protein